LDQKSLKTPNAATNGALPPKKLDHIKEAYPQFPRFNFKVSLSLSFLLHDTETTHSAAAFAGQEHAGERSSSRSEKSLLQTALPATGKESAVQRKSTAIIGQIAFAAEMSSKSLQLRKASPIATLDAAFSAAEAIA
jgi:hypothetical protein